MERLLRCSLVLLPGQRNVSRRSRSLVWFSTTWFHHGVLHLGPSGKNNTIEQDSRGTIVEPRNDGILDWTARGSPHHSCCQDTRPGRMAEFSNPVEVETGGIKAFSVPTQACDGDGFDHNSTTSATFSLAIPSHNARIIHGPSLFLRIYVSIRIVGWPSLPLFHK